MLNTKDWNWLKDNHKLYIIIIYFFIDFEMKHFWNWTHFADYMKCVVLFVLFGSIVTFCFANYPVYLESLGFVSVFTEAMLGAPQFYRNYKNKSTTGMRYEQTLKYLRIAISFYYKFYPSYIKVTFHWKFYLYFKKRFSINQLSYYTGCRTKNYDIFSH